MSKLDSSMDLLLFPRGGECWITFDSTNAKWIQYLSHAKYWILELYQSIGLFQKCLAAQNYWLHYQTNAKCGMTLKYPPFEKKKHGGYFKVSHWLIDWFQSCHQSDTIDWLPFFLQRFGSKKVDTIQCLKMGCILMASGKVQRFSCGFTTCFFFPGPYVERAKHY